MRLILSIFIFMAGTRCGVTQIVIQELSHDKATFGPCVLQLDAGCDSTFLSFNLYNDFYYANYHRLNISSPDGGNLFDPGLPMKIIVHGYGGAFDMYNPTGRIKDAYLLKGGINVIVVDWAQLSNTPCYPIAVINTWHVGKCIAELLIALEMSYPTAFQPSSVHVVGFSLGAHVAGYASDYLVAHVGYKLNRITGLDPALPLFSTMSDRWKLDSSDAEFVDVIHTNVGVLGKVEATGHADFYVNGGTKQKACRHVRNPSLCSHLLAPVYFAESIHSLSGFWGISCPNYYQYVIGWCPENKYTMVQRMIMGEYCSPNTLGVYIVTTSADPPYALG